MSVSQRVTQNQYFIYLRKGKEKTDMEILEEILNQNNLNKVYKKVVTNKGVAGVDGITVEEEFDYLKENKDRIINQIRKRKYKPQPVKRVQIPKENGKKRNLGIPTVTDRMIVDIDLEKFFDTVNQDKLITIIGKTITDGDVVSLIRKYLSAGVMERGKRTKLCKIC